MEDEKQGKPMHDLVICGAAVADGLGHDPIRADVAVKDGHIAASGEVGKDASGMVDAGGLALMPGIIDLHTHYDAQVTLDPTLSPSPPLVVTTAIMGNCGFGIVPSPPHLRDPIGVLGVFVNGVRGFDGKDYTRLDKGPGQVLDRFLPARAAPTANAAR
jgi:N-acyl-D-aspartate/D-glutamate deacylase